MVTRGKIAVGIVVSCIAFGWAAEAQAGTQGPTESLGKSKGLEYVTAPFDGIVTQAGPHANCDEGDIVTGGGGSIAGQASSAHLNATYPVGPTYDAWQAEGTSHLNGPRTVTSYAICTSKSVSWTSSGTQQVAMGATQGFGTACPTGTGTGGGISSLGGDLELLGDFDPSVTFERSAFVHNDGAATSTINQFVGCSTELSVKIRQGSKTVKPGKSGKLKVACAEKEAVLSGGYDFAAQPGFELVDSNLNASIPFDSKSDKKKVPDDGWSVRAFNGAASTQTLRAFAACLK